MALPRAVPRLTGLTASRALALIALLQDRTTAALLPAGMATAPAAAAPAAAAPPDSWMYSADGQPKGPLPGFSLLRLLERGVVPPNATVWAPHLSEWAPITEADGLATRAKLCRQRFYVMDRQERRGPFILGELRRRFEAGEIDGLSQIFVEGSEAWQQLSSVEGLRDVLQPPQLQQEVEAEAFVPDETEQPQKEKTRSFKGDDGVSYVFRDGDWVPGEASESEEEVPPEKPVAEPKKKKRKKKQGWDAKTTKCWIYVTGLPPDATADELAEHFGKCGAIARDLENAPKIKLYRDDAGALKGDASLCYANASSVDVACSILDGGSLRFDVPLRVTKADFGSARYGAFDQSKVKKVNPQKAHVARRAQRQAQNWSYDVDSGASPENAMRIVVVESCFSIEDAPVQEVLDEKEKSKYDLFAESVQKELLGLLEGGGAPLDRAVVHRHGVVVFKFKEPADAQKSVKVWDSAAFRGRKLKAAFWDGVTDYTRVAKEAEEKAEGGEEKRIDAFGDWLEDQGELPPELQLRVEE